MFTDDALAPDGYDRVYQGYVDKIIVTPVATIFTGNSSTCTLLLVIIGMTSWGVRLRYQTLTA